MSGMKAFLRQNAIHPKNEKVALSNRFIGEDGKPMEWEIRPLSENENDAIKETCTDHTRKKGRPGAEFNGRRYSRLLCVQSVVFPDLSDAELQKSYGVTDSEDLLGVMLLPGECAELIQFVHQVNGFEVERFEEEKQEAKNS